MPVSSVAFQRAVTAVAIYVQGERMGGWSGKLPDWQMAIAWLVTVAIAMLVHFLSDIASA